MTFLALTLALSAAPQPFFWPKPEVVEEIDIPGVMQADGVPVRLHVMRSKLGVQQLLSVFASAFENAGFYVQQVQKRVTAEPHVTGLDPKAFVSYSAILSPNPDGTTTCLLGEAALSKKKTGGDFVPLFPGARDAMRVNQEGARLLTYSVAKATAGEVHQFYGEALGSAGWRAESPGVFVKGAERISVMPQAAEGGGVSVVVVQRRE